jgi:hypothetical protein
MFETRRWGGAAEAAGNHKVASAGVAPAPREKAPQGSAAPFKLLESNTYFLQWKIAAKKSWTGCAVAAATLPW